MRSLLSRLLTLIKHMYTRNRRRFIIGLIVAVGFVALIWSPWAQSPQQRNLSEVQQLITDHQVESAQLFDDHNRIELHTIDGGFYHSNYPVEYGDELTTLLVNNDIDFQSMEFSSGWLSRNWASLLSTLFLLILPLSLLWQVGSGMMEGVLGKSDFKSDRPWERFAHVKGADEAVAELTTLVDFLRHPKRYEHIQVPRGYLFYGPTGTGKTMLARATAGEAGCEFHYLSGSNLSSVFAGGTSQRVERFFERIIKNGDQSKPVVVFLDELDGLASLRAGSTGADRDTNTSVTQLLHQVTRFFAHFPYGVLIGASNNIKALDPAVIRDGRFGIHIPMPNPDKEARASILRQFSQHFDTDGVDMVAVAQLLPGMSGAALSTLPHIAALIAKREGIENNQLSMHHFEQAAMQMSMGSLRRSAVIPESDLQVSRVHESGHSVVAHASPFHNLQVVTTYPTNADPDSPNGGSTWCPRRDSMVMTFDNLIWSMAVSMGGRAAERLDLNHVSSGPAHDIEHATALAIHAICVWGLFDDFTSYIDPKHWRDHPQANDISYKIKELIDEAEERATNVLMEHQALRHAIQAGLAEKRILHGQEIAELVAATSSDITDEPDNQNISV